MEYETNNFVMLMEETHPDCPKEFSVYVKDRAAHTEERWVAAHLNEADAKKLYEYLKQCFE